MTTYEIAYHPNGTAFAVRSEHGVITGCCGPVAVTPFDEPDEDALATWPYDADPTICAAVDGWIDEE